MSSTTPAAPPPSERLGHGGYQTWDDAARLRQRYLDSRRAAIKVYPTDIDSSQIEGGVPGRALDLEGLGIGSV